MRAILPAIIAILTAWLIIILTRSDRLIGLILTLASPIGLAIAIGTLLADVKCLMIPSRERMLWSVLLGLLVIAFGIISIFVILIVSIGGFGPPD